jgi:hypothetical protein
MLGINDDVMTDNSGSYSVNISREGDNNNNNNNRRGGDRAFPRR